MQRRRLLRIDANSQEIAEALLRGAQPTVLLDAELSHHFIRVARATVGTPIIATSKAGGPTFRGLLVNKDPATIQILGIENELHWHARVSILIVGAIRGNRLDWICEKATELGIEQLWVAQVTRSEPGSLSPQRLARLERLAEAAAEQSSNPSPPSIQFFPSLTETLATLAPQPGIRSLMSLRPEALPLQSLSIDHATPLIIAVGPEGDFDDQESNLLMEQRFIPTSLGPPILRVETAAIAGISAANALWGFRQLSSTPLS